MMVKSNDSLAQPLLDDADDPGCSASAALDLQADEPHYGADGSGNPHKYSLEEVTIDDSDVGGSMSSRWDEEVHVPPANLQKSFLNVLLVGESGLGKSTFVNTLFNKDIIPRSSNGNTLKTLKITPYEDIRTSATHQLKITVFDTPGYGDDPYMHRSWYSIIEFIEQRHREYAYEKIYYENAEDKRIDICFYFCPPHRFKDCDTLFLSLLLGSVFVVPVLAKADAMTQAETEAYRETVREKLSNCVGMDMEEVSRVFTAMNLGAAGHFPPTIIGCEMVSSGLELRRDYDNMRIRRYLWGEAEIDNPKHCDMSRLRAAILQSHDFHRIKAVTSRRWADFMNQDTKGNRILTWCQRYLTVMVPPCPF